MRFAAPQAWLASTNAKSPLSSSLMSSTFGDETKDAESTVIIARPRYDLLVPTDLTKRRLME